MNFSIATLILAIWAGSETIIAAREGPRYSSQALTPAPTPSSDCFNLINGMMDCISFLSGEDPAPGEPCCFGLKTAMEVNAYCICYGLEMGSELGFEIDMARAEAMPDDCSITAAPISFCNISSTVPAASPETTPPSAKSPSPAPHFHPPAAVPTPSTSPAPGSISPSPETATPSPETAIPAPSHTPIRPPAADTPAQEGGPPSAPSSDTGIPPPASDQPRRHPKFAIFSITFVLGVHQLLQTL